MTKNTRSRKSKAAKKGEKLATLSQVKRIVRGNSELKYLQQQQTPTFLDWNGFNQQLGAMPQGTDDGQRVGSQIKYASIDLRFSITNADIAWARVRMVMYWYRQEDAFGPIVTDVLQVTGAVNSVVTSYNFRNQGAYQIIYDKVFTVTSSSTVLNSVGYRSIGGSPAISGRIRKKLKNKQGQYSGPLSSDEMTKGYLGLIMISDVSNAMANSAKPAIAWHLTLRYYDS